MIRCGMYLKVGEVWYRRINPFGLCLLKPFTIPWKPLPRDYLNPRQRRGWNATEAMKVMATQSQTDSRLPQRFWISVPIQA